MTSVLICNQYQNIPTSGFHDIGVIFPILGPPAPTSHRHWQQPPAGGRAGRRRATAQALQQAQPLDPRHAQTFCRPGGLPSIHRAAAAQATAEKSVKLEKNLKNLMTLMCHCHDSGSIYMRCKTLASSLVGLIRARQLHHTRAHLSRRVAHGHL
jgi:hypothetical protein